MAIRGCSGMMCLIYDDNLHCPAESIAGLEARCISVEGWTEINTTHMPASPAAA